MSQEIHARETEKGIRFRVWSTISDSYVTEEMTEEELREYSLIDAVGEAIRRHLREIDKRIQRAREKGNSSYLIRETASPKLTASWDEERE